MKGAIFEWIWDNFCPEASIIPHNINEGSARFSVIIPRVGMKTESRFHVGASLEKPQCG